MTAMASLVRLRHAAVGVTALALSCTLAAGCGAASKHAARLTPGAGSSNPGLTGSSTTADAGPSSTTPTTEGSSTTVVRAAAGGSSAPNVAGPSAPGPSASGPPAPAAPGTYTEDQSGGVTAGAFSSSEPATGTLVIDPVQSNGIQVSHRYIDPKQPPAETDTQFRSNGPFILSTTEASPQGNTTCTFNPPIPAPQWPTSAGESFSSQGNCGSFTVSVQGRITGTQSVTLQDHETFTVWVIDSTLNMSGQVTGSGTQVDWYSPAVRLPLHEQVDLNGTYSGLNFKLHSVSDLESSHPT
jgi:hypothetical protein